MTPGQELSMQFAIGRYNPEQCPRAIRLNYARVRKLYSLNVLLLPAKRRRSCPILAFTVSRVGANSAPLANVTRSPQSNFTRIFYRSGASVPFVSCLVTLWSFYSMTPSLIKSLNFCVHASYGSEA
ncbi:hypothetical protein NDU88_009437 [Pleurodeles waltl]|uniref:Uncharacterized protein n=1 Tax=Pleurodeles waltl TaxID=8319 RepID=A0AAV7RV82_PLEWA|nr:hypothetical protein NDU88_009437 [Pleurodeles waltl]